MKGCHDCRALRASVARQNEKIAALTIERDAAKREADKVIIANATMESEIRSLRGKLGHERSIKRKRW